MSNKKTNLIYLALDVDILHPIHLEAISFAQNHGEVVIGLLDDEAFPASPMLSYLEREKLISQISGVKRIIKQKSNNFLSVLRQIKPAHFSYLYTDPSNKIDMDKNLDDCKNLATTWKGKYLELPSLGNINHIHSGHVSRVRKLRTLLKQKSLVRILEVHNGLTGLIAEKTTVQKGKKLLEFDGMWESSLTDSLSKGKPDTSVIDVTSRLLTIQQILNVTHKPLIMDGDNGGLTEHFVHTVPTLERLGISAVIIEDKVGPKRNSLFGTDVDQEQDSIEEFSEKINAGKKSQLTKDFMIFARIESLILDKGLDDAVKRAKAYLEAGADGIMIHSKAKNPAEILAFAHEYQSFRNGKPLVVVPTTYNKITEKELIEAGINIVIYANHMLRSAYPSMVKTAEIILKKQRSYEADKLCMPISKILNLIPLPQL